MLLTPRIAVEISFCDLPRVPIDKETKKARAVDLGKRVRAAREARGLEQKNLAAAGDVSQSYISQIERGEIDDPSAFVLRAIETLLGLYSGYLTEPAETHSAREAAITRLVKEHGKDLRIKPEEEQEIRLRLAFIDPGPNPPMIYLVKILELIRTVIAVGQGKAQ